MNNFNKVYSAKELKNNKMVTILSLPMEESIMVPVSQMVDLMKQGENVLFFSFNHDSIKVNEFMQNALKHESSPETITGLNAVFDAHQIPAGTDWFKFVEETVKSIRKSLATEGKELGFVFLDLFPYVETDSIRPADEELVSSLFLIMAFTEKITPVVLRTMNMPVITAVQNSDNSQKEMEELMDRDMMTEMLKESITLTNQSDFIIGIKREKNNFWKKLVNFLLFWRKRNNFTLKVLKNRNVSNKKSYRLNLDMETFKTEVL
jgi:hypothetical protein